jgi:RND family efflux transporter MFP subunit
VNVRIISPRNSRLIRNASLGVTFGFLVAFAVLHHSQHPTASDGEEGVAAAPQTLRAVAVYPVKLRDLTREMTLSAELRPYDVVNVYAKVSGYLKSILVDYGSRVHAGEVVAALELPEQEADVARSNAAYRLAKLDYERIRSVVRAQPGLIAQADVDKARSVYEITKSQNEQARSLLDYGVITAPFDGIVTKRYVDPGALIQQGTASSTQAEPIVQIADAYRLRLVIETPESVVPEIHVGTPVEVKIQATGEIVHANVVRFSYDVHEDTRTMHTEVDIPNADLHLKPGMYASVALVLDARRAVPSVPVQALSTDKDPSVWMIDAHDEVQRRRVRIGMQTPNWVEILSGLAPGERVFIGDGNGLSAGMKVRPRIASLVEHD